LLFLDEKEKAKKIFGDEDEDEDEDENQEWNHIHFFLFTSQNLN